MERAVELFFKGGLVMYPLVLASIFVVAILLERICFYRKSMLAGDDFLKRIIPFLREKDYQGAEGILTKSGMLGQIVKAGIEGREISYEIAKEGMQEMAVNQIHMLKNNIGYLDTIVTMAPLLGLLGTVVGMIGSFSVLDVSSGKPFAITGGVAEALIATATGLAVAIIALLSYTYLNNKVDSYITEMEKVAAKSLSFLR